MKNKDVKLTVTYDLESGLVAMPIEQWREVLKQLELNHTVSETWPKKLKDIKK